MYSARSRCRRRSSSGETGSRTLVAIDAVLHQRVARVEDLLDLFDAVAFFALADVLLREHEVVDDRTRVGPRAIQVVVLEERVVAVARMRDDERLHRHRVLFHQIRDARVRVDDDLVRETHVAALVAALRFDEVFAERPVVVAERHADRRICIEHLIRADHFDLVRIRVEPEFAREPRRSPGRTGGSARTSTPSRSKSACAPAEF